MLPFQGKEGNRKRVTMSIEITIGWTIGKVLSQQMTSKKRWLQFGQTRRSAPTANPWFMARDNG
jgi:hypothetical protein